MQPAAIELQLYYPGGGHGASGIPRDATRSALRFPVGQAAWNEAEKVVAHYRGETPRKPDFFHGTGDGTEPEDLTKCYLCGYETYRLLSHCPRCGRAMRSKRWSRRYGWILLAIGIFISAVMGLVLSAIAMPLLNPGAGGLRFSGTREQGRLILALLGAVELFGIAAICYGLWQIVTGRRNKWVIYFFIGLCVALPWLQSASSGQKLAANVLAHREIAPSGFCGQG